MDKLALAAYIAAPWVLWPLTFIVFQDYFIYAMVVSTGLLGAWTLLLLPGVRERLRPRKNWGLAATAYTLVLYAAFAGGNTLSELVGLGNEVTSVYTMVGRNLLLAVPLAWIGFWEEVYWRGGLQEEVFTNKLRLPWYAASLPYALVHVSTGNLVLVAAALVVGLILGHEAHKYNLPASISTHVAWLYLVLIVAPFR